MEGLFGAVFKDFTLVAADMTAAQSILVMKNDEGKIHKISDKLFMAVTGDSGDTVQFAEFIAKNIQLYKMRNGYELSPRAAAYYTRKQLAEYLRSRSPYNCNMLIAGYDPEEGPQLFFIDYLASLIEIPYITHGYPGIVTLSIMGEYHRKDMSVQEAYDMFSKCVQEVQKRLIINVPNFKVSMVSKDGITHLPPIKARNIPEENKGIPETEQFSPIPVAV